MWYLVSKVENNAVINVTHKAHFLISGIWSKVVLCLVASVQLRTYVAQHKAEDEYLSDNWERSEGRCRSLF
jgi:hypothetical protein